MFLGLNGSPGYNLFHYHRGTIGWLCLGPTCLGKPGVAQALCCFAYDLLQLALHLHGPFYLVHELLELVWHLLHPVYLVHNPLELVEHPVTSTDYCLHFRLQGISVSKKGSSVQADTTKQFLKQKQVKHAYNTRSRRKKEL